VHQLTLKTEQDALELRKRIAVAVRSCVRGDVDDVVQELWLWAWRRGKSAETVSYIELKHRAWDVLRAVRKHEHEDIAQAREAEAAEGGLDARCEQLHDVLEQGTLSTFQETVLLRRYWFGDSVQDTATRTGRRVEEVVDAEQTALATIAQELYRRACDEQ